MRTLKISLFALGLAAIPGVAQAGAESSVRHHMGNAMGGHVRGNMPRPNIGHQAPRPNIGHHAPRPQISGHQGGYNGGRNYLRGRYHSQQLGGYRRPARGFYLPTYWAQPSFYIPNYSTFGFAQPSYGYGWSRYYNDAVLTDRYGQVQDSVYDVDWDRYDNGYGNGRREVSYEDGYYERDSRRTRDRRGRRGSSGIGGAIAGGAVGAIAGSAIAGRGERLAGGLIGGGLGALAGAAIDSASSRDRGYRGERRADGPYYDNGGYGATYEGGYEDRGQVYEVNGQSGPHWTDVDTRGGNREVYEERRTYPASGPAPRLEYPNQGYSYGYGYEPQVTTVTIQPQPVTTTTTTTYVEEEIVYASAVRKRAVHKAPRKAWKPRPKPRCVCKVVYR